MELIINVDESMFKDIVEKELEALPKEKVQEIIIEGITKYFNESEILRGLFVTQKLTNGWNSSYYDVPTDLLKSYAEKSDKSYGKNIFGVKAFF